MSSLDTIYNINLSTPVDVVLEPYTKVSGNVEVNLGIVPRAFKGGTDLKIYTDSTGTTQLTDGVDYELTVIDDYYTSEAGFNVYVSFKLINPAYYDKNLWITSKVLGSYVTAGYLSRVNDQEIERQAFIDGNMRVWPQGSSFVNPTDGTYTHGLTVINRSGVTADSVIVSEDLINVETGCPQSLKLEVTAIGTDAGTGLTGLEWRVTNIQKLLGSDNVFRWRGIVPDGEEFILKVDWGTGSTSETFEGIGDFQDAYINVSIPAGATEITAFQLIRDTANGIIPVVGDYITQNIQLHSGDIPLPFFKRETGESKRLVRFHFERISDPQFLLRWRAVRGSVNDFVFIIPFDKKRDTGTGVIGGAEGIDWDIRNFAGTPVAGFSLAIVTDKQGYLRITATQVAHGMTDASFSLRTGAAGYIDFDARK